VYLSDGHVGVALISRPDQPWGINHFGFVVDDVKAIEEATQTKAEANTFGAVAESWIHDPEGNRVDINVHGWPGGRFPCLSCSRSSRARGAMRRLKPDPVPDELVQKILRAGVCAANGGNTQRWRFLVVKDQAIKKKVQVYYKRRARRGGGAALSHERAAPRRHPRAVRPPALGGWRRR